MADLAERGAAAGRRLGAARAAGRHRSDAGGLGMPPRQREVREERVGGGVQLDGQTVQTVYRWAGPRTCLALELVNGSVLTEALAADSTVRTRSQPAICLLVLFYGRSCPFSAAAAPHLNALPRVFPDLRVLAVDALENGSLNTRFGIIAVPTVLLFHNGRPVARYNQSEPTLERLAEFISSHTLLSAGGPLEITDADLAGPLPTVAEHRLDWYLVAAWLFIIVCVACAATRLRLWRRAADTVRAWWLEAEQHLHEE
ncbi:Thioredoxin domain-containing protein 15 [Amphibalanus amphitrite]|uniref:Thioredoxin domain-containing protein 15 n=1 Tax=Amphibalanus amphitrite TaxID=1232801 RepID=A0A6A4X6U4_AMPAM|nr:Thioredoxin domain-containing protein 15 [Amphibalanus amphitrite]